MMMIMMIIIIIIIIILPGRERNDMHSVAVIHEYAAQTSPPLLQYSLMLPLTACPHQFLQSQTSSYN